MKVHRKGTDDAIKLRLALNEKTTDELQQILLRRDPANTRRFLHSVKMRNAATAVLKVRRQLRADGGL